MENKTPSAAEHAIVGAGVGAAGATSTIGLVGLSVGTVAALTIAIVAGAIGGLAWWAMKSTGKES